MSAVGCEVVQGESVICELCESLAEFWRSAWSPYWIGAWDLWNGMKAGPQEELPGHWPAWLP